MKIQGDSLPSETMQTRLTLESRILITTFTRKSLLYLRLASKDLGFISEGAGLYRSQLRTENPLGGDYTCLPLGRKNNSLKSSLYKAGHLKDRTLAPSSHTYLFPWDCFLSRHRKTQSIERGKLNVKDNSADGLYGKTVKM